MAGLATHEVNGILADEMVRRAPDEAAALCLAAKLALRAPALLGGACGRVHPLYPNPSLGCSCWCASLGL